VDDNYWSFYDKVIAMMRFSLAEKYIAKDSVLVDIGCGINGDFLKYMSKKIKAGYGFDYKISSHSKDNISFINIDNIEQGIPLEDNRADYATLLALIEHLDRPNNLIKEVYRVLKPGGLIILTTPAPKAKWLLEFLAYRLKIIAKSEISDHKHYFQKYELVAMLNMEGFTNIRVSSFQLGFNTLAVAVK